MKPIPSSPRGLPVVLPSVPVSTAPRALRLVWLRRDAAGQPRTQSLTLPFGAASLGKEALV